MLSGRFQVFCLSVLVAGSCAAQPTAASNDRFRLASEPTVYLIHRAAQQSFLLGRTSYAVIGGPMVAMAQTHGGTTLQQGLNLVDPVSYAKDRLAERLRRDLGLTNLVVISEGVNIPIIPEDFVPQPGQAAPDETFSQKHPVGAVIEMTTQYWGLDNTRVRYYAEARLKNLAESKILLSTHCSWVILEIKLPLDGARGTGDPNSVVAYDPALEKALNADRGAALREGLRKAAEVCADKLAGRFQGGGREAKVSSP